MAESHREQPGVIASIRYELAYDRDKKKGLRAGSGEVIINPNLWS
jgi:hypothetical protein